MDQMSSQLRERLLILIERAKRDKATLDSPAHDDGERIYARLFDALQATLHNLNGSEDAAKHRGKF